MASFPRFCPVFPWIYLTFLHPQQPLARSSTGLLPVVQRTTICLFWTWLQPDSFMSPGSCTRHLDAGKHERFQSNKRSSKYTCHPACFIWSAEVAGPTTLYSTVLSQEFDRCQMTGLVRGNPNTGGGVHVEGGSQLLKKSSGTSWKTPGLVNWPWNRNPSTLILLVAPPFNSFLS